MRGCEARQTAGPGLEKPLWPGPNFSQMAYSTSKTVSFIATVSILREHYSVRSAACLTCHAADCGAARGVLPCMCVFNACCWLAPRTECGQQRVTIQHITAAQQHTQPCTWSCCIPLCDSFCLLVCGATHDEHDGLSRRPCAVRGSPASCLVLHTHKQRRESSLI